MSLYISTGPVNWNYHVSSVPSSLLVWQNLCIWQMYSETKTASFFLFILLLDSFTHLFNGFQYFSACIPLPRPPHSCTGTLLYSPSPNITPPFFVWLSSVCPECGRELIWYRRENISVAMPQKNMVLIPKQPSVSSSSPCVGEFSGTCPCIMKYVCVQCCSGLVQISITITHSWLQ